MGSRGNTSDMACTIAPQRYTKTFDPATTAPSTKLRQAIKCDEARRTEGLKHDDGGCRVAVCRGTKIVVGTLNPDAV
jgi:hypothetical protein